MIGAGRSPRRWGFWALLSCCILGFAGCGGSSGEGDTAAPNTARLTLRLVAPRVAPRSAVAGQSRQAIPGDADFISRLRVRIMATDITLIAQEFPVTADEQDEVRVELVVPIGEARRIVVTALNEAEEAVFRGETTTDLTAATQQVEITLISLLEPTTRLVLTLIIPRDTTPEPVPGALRQVLPGAVDFITQVRVRVTAVDITPVTQQVAVAEEQQEQIVVELDVPTGEARRIVVTAFNEVEDAIFRGETTTNLLETMQQVALTLDPVVIPEDNNPPVPTAPDIVAGSSPNAEVGSNTPGSSQISVNDPDAGQSHTFAITGEPAHGTAEVSASGLVTYTPDFNFTGTDSVTVTVTDNGSPPLSGDVTLNVNVCSNRLPISDPPPPITVAVGMTGTTGIQIVTTRPHTLDALLAEPAMNGDVTLSMDGADTIVVAYTPDTGFTGNDSFLVEVQVNFTDGGCPPEQRGTFRIDAVVGASVAALITSIEEANQSEVPITIELGAGTLTITDVHNNTDGANGLPSITGFVQIIGAGSASTILEGPGFSEGGTPLRLFHITPGGILQLQNLQIRDGVALANGSEDRSGFGGAILNQEEGTVLLDNVMLVTNQATADGGAIANFGTASLTGSVVMNNTADGRGGGLMNGVTVNDGTGAMILFDSTIQDNQANLSGGGIFNLGNCSMLGSTISGNVAETGGGIANQDGAGSGNTQLGVLNSTISGNRSRSNGGGIDNTQGGEVVLIQSTMGNNTASQDGGGLFNASENSVSLLNTIIAANIAGQGPECFGTLMSLGHNLIQDDTACALVNVGEFTGDVLGVAANFGPLQDNGGGTATHALLPGSPAIDAGDTLQCLETDQRGVGRPLDGDNDGEALCDIGAFEFDN